MTPMQHMLLGVGGKKKTYLDDVFSNYLYDGTGGAQSINNGIDFAGEGGAVWCKSRNQGYNHMITDTVRGVGKTIGPNITNPELSGGPYAQRVTAFNSNGFTLGTDNGINDASGDYVSWSFRKAPGFFTVCQWSGNATGGREISHDLNSVPGMILVKETTGTQQWYVYHRDTGPSKYLVLNSTGGAVSGTDFTNGVTPTSTAFTLSSDAAVNGNSKDYIAYLFAGGESTAATARSVDFDGTSDWLTLASSTDLDMGTGDFTVEFWYKGGSYTASSDRQVIIAANKTWGAGFHQIRISDVDSARQNRIVIWDYDTDSSAPIFVSNYVYLPHVWRHIAVTRTGGNLYVYVNGALDKSISYTAAFNLSGGSGTMIGYNPTNTGFVGNISNLRVVKGTAVYTSSFKVPIEPLTNITNTKLLCCNNSATTGSTVTPGTITANGDPTASTDTPFDDPAGFKFGKNEDQNIIKCGSITTDSSNGATLHLPWEPQWFLFKRTDATSNWTILDSMRGWTADGTVENIHPNLNNAETAGGGYEELTARTIKFQGYGNNYNFIWIAIRRPDGYVGKPPELGTSVFNMVMGTSNSDVPAFVSGFVTDFAFNRQPAASENWWTQSRLTGDKYVITNSTAAEASSTPNKWDYHNGWYAATSDQSAYQSWMWKRHAGFDVVTYTGNGSSTGDTQKIPHGLNQIPEMVWIKNRSGSADWGVYHKDMHGSIPEKYYMKLNTDAARVYNDQTFDSPTATHFNLRHNALVNSNNSNFTMMLFSSVSGISKVGSYTGTGNTTGPVITTGFTPRFILFKNISSSGKGWRMLDTLRGLGTSSQKGLRLNLNAGQDATGGNYITTTSTSFQPILSTSEFNESGSTIIYYAHA